MASYFDLPPQQKAGAANIDSIPEDQRKELGRMSFLSPAVSQLLDDLGQEQSDSDSEEGSLSEEDTKRLNKLSKKTDPLKSRLGKGPNTQPSKKSPLSPRKSGSPKRVSAVRVKSPPARTGGGGSAKPKQPHMARFHSLRSMLFSNTIEDKMKTATHEDCEKEAVVADRWKSQHVQRQMHSRPKTPEKEAESKDHGLGSRLKTKIRRMTSKEVPTMETLKEDGIAHDFSDHGSTASSDNEDEPYQWKPREADEESINHSDVEDLVRWVSRRDPPSDGEARAAGKEASVTNIKEGSGNDSIGDSDVDDLVHWASRKSSGPETKQDRYAGYSDASTESDSEMAKEQDSSDEENADDLVRWISHRDGPTAGPVRRSRDANSNSPNTQSHVDYDSDVPELSRWITRHDGTSGESGATTPVRDLQEEPERGRPRSRDGPFVPQPRGHLSHDDVDELVRWVSRKDSKQISPSNHDYTPEKSKSAAATSSSPDPTASPRTLEVETGDLRTMRRSGHESQKSAAREYLKQSRVESTQIDQRDTSTEAGAAETEEEREHRGSLGLDDVDELVKWVSRKS
ncbi:hypothetical protein CC86DRAFT_367499 [Ophiobolus disseminans]|uniref:Uncharacterized protein n=1 Tax=Ophiobolus disseminans TaxID=1469910 RepID=A0A6A7ADV8_9PLEO|nr:hypothetical protein CC86DRAFT_367499 [Ophiobolus disseminans]